MSPAALLGVTIGGALGALARYLTGLALHGVGFPLATLLVNVIGAFLLSLLVHLGTQNLFSKELKLALGTGFLGSLTTFSTFELESYQLGRDGAYLALGLYVLGNLVLGFAAVLLGRALAFRLLA